MYTPARLMWWATPVLVLALVMTGSISQTMAQPWRSCPVGGYAITACPVISDEVIRDQIASRLAGSVASAAYPITIDVCNGVVTLRGQVDNRGKWDLAYVLVGRVRGVVGFNNYLTTDPTNEEDLALIGRVKTAIARQPIDSAQIHVRTNQGVVQLSGMVNSEFDRYDAAAAAQAVPGVTAVYNNITVRGSSVGTPF